MVLPEAKDSISSVCVVEHEIMSGSIDGRVRVYDLRMGMVYIDVIGRECAPLHHYPSPPPSHSPYAFEDVETGNCSPAVAHGLKHANKTPDPVTSLTPTKQSDSLLVSSLDSALRLMDKPDGKLLKAYKAPEVHLPFIPLSPLFTPQTQLTRPPTVPKHDLPYPQRPRPERQHRA